jgi:methylated-DNA-[protein]-cysteine S-methyltransferase
MARRPSTPTPIVPPLYTGQLADTLLGDLWIAVTEQGLAAVAWAADEAAFAAWLARRFQRPAVPDPQAAAQAAAEIGEYLAGQRRRFSLPVDWSLLRPFQRAALQATQAIPYGQTSTYGQIAARIGRPRAARAVGRAQAVNPMPLVIPCHRVIGADGKLHGYGGGEGLKTKEWLLRMEGALIT